MKNGQNITSIHIYWEPMENLKHHKNMSKHHKNDRNIMDICVQNWLKHHIHSCLVGAYGESKT